MQWTLFGSGFEIDMQITRQMRQERIINNAYIERDVNARSHSRWEEFDPAEGFRYSAAVQPDLAR